MTIRTIMVLLLLCLCCRPLPPSHISNPARHPKYPVANYFTAVGISAKDRQTAETSAKAEVAKQVKSTLAAVSLNKMEYERSGNADETSERSVELFSEKIELQTSFDRAELIRIDPDSYYQDDKQFYVFAYLSKNELCESYYRGYESKENGFAKLIDLAKQAFYKDDYPLFHKSLRDSEPLFAEMSKFYLKINTVLGRRYERHLANERRYLALIKQRIEWQKKSIVYLALFGTFAAEKTSFWQDSFISVMKNLGITAVPAKTCPVQTPYNFLASLQIEERCSEPFFGHQCNLSITGSISSCNDGRVVSTIDLSDLDIKGSNAESIDRALAKAYASIDFISLTKSFSAKLQTVLPITLEEP